MDAISRFAVARQPRQVNEMFRFTGDFVAEVCLVIWTQGVTEHLQWRLIEQFIHIFLKLSIRYEIKFIAFSKNEVHTEYVSNASYLDITALMEARHTLHQVRRRMITEVGTDVAYPQPSFTGCCILRVVVRRLVKHVDLQNTEIPNEGAEYHLQY